MLKRKMAAMLRALLQRYATDVFCKWCARSVAQEDAKYSTSQGWLIVCVAHIDRAVQVLVQQKL